MVAVTAQAAVEPSTPPLDVSRPPPLTLAALAALLAEPRDVATPATLPTPGPIDMPLYPVVASGWLEQRRGAGWISAMAYTAWRNEVRHRLATLGVNETHQQSCVLVIEGWKRSVPEEMMADAASLLVSDDWIFRPRLVSRSSSEGAADLASGARLATSLSSGLGPPPGSRSGQHGASTLMKLAPLRACSTRRRKGPTSVTRPTVSYRPTSTTRTKR